MKPRANEPEIEIPAGATSAPSREPPRLAHLTQPAEAQAGTSQAEVGASIHEDRQRRMDV